MTRDDIIAMAREAGLGWDDKYHWYVGSEALERFANLVAAAEREACAKVLDDWKKHNWTFEDCAAVVRARGEK